MNFIECGRGNSRVWEAALYLRLTERTVRELIANGTLKTQKVGSSRIIRNYDLRQLVNPHVSTFKEHSQEGYRGNEKSQRNDVGATGNNVGDEHNGNGADDS
jgi:excisionase family DNA binding protein